VIDNQPPGAKDLVVSLFGTNDKLALETLILVVAIAIGALLGVLAVRRSYVLAVGGFVAFAAVGFFAALRSPSAMPTTALIVAIVAAVGGIQTMSLLLSAGRPGQTATGAPIAIPSPDWSRRTFLLQAAAAAAVTSVAGLIGRRLLDGPS